MTKYEFIVSWNSHIGGAHLYMDFIEKNPRFKDEIMKAIMEEASNEFIDTMVKEVRFIEQLMKYRKK